MNPYSHIKEEFGASHPDYRVEKRCIPDCPACAYDLALREVGEWLNKNWIVTQDVLPCARFANRVVVALLRSEMPEEVKE